MVTTVILSIVCAVLFLWVIVLGWWLKNSMEREVELIDRNHRQGIEIARMKSWQRAYYDHRKAQLQAEVSKEYAS